MRDPDTTLRRIPSVDEVLKTAPALGAAEQFGRPAVVAAVRAQIDDVRRMLTSDAAQAFTVDEIAAAGVDGGGPDGPPAATTTLTAVRTA